MTSEPLDLIGVGIGPFNLSIAALASEVPDLEARFFDENEEFRWHPGMMLEGVRLQTSPLKDLVTGVDPSNPNGFIDYLVDQGRFYEFLHADLPAVSRREFEDYMRWAASRIDDLVFGRRIEEVTVETEAFLVHTEGREQPVRARNLVVGTGQRPDVPECARGKLDEAVFHNHDIRFRDLDLDDERVAVVGGGQSGAEVFEAIADGRWGDPARVDWLTRRPNFQPLDEVAFTNEYFTPSYVDVFHELDPDRRREVVREQKLASDGVSPATLRSLYRDIYEQRALGDDSYRLLPGREVRGLREGSSTRLEALNRLTGERERYEEDVVVLCTGYTYAVPPFLDPILPRLEPGEDQPFALDRNYRIRWDGPEELGLYAVNAGRFSHGIAEPQLSLACQRSATILNDVADREVYDRDRGLEMVQWDAPEGSRPRPSPELVRPNRAP